ncbi:MAG: EamA family transporter [Actinobacteria bacterium]|nr:EamA family transporter [Actinomycetota bacterium]
MSKATIVSILLLVLSIGLAVAGQLSMKAGMSKVVEDGGELSFADFKNPVELASRIGKSVWAVIGVLLYAISAVFWLIVLSRVDLSVAYPLVAAGYVVVVFYSWLVFKEDVKWFTWVGLILIVAGVVIAGQGLAAGDDDKSDKTSIERKAEPTLATEAAFPNETSISNNN